MSMRRPHKFLALSVSDQLLIVRCALLLGVVRLGLNTCKLATVRRELDRWFKASTRRGSRRRGLGEDGELASVARAVRRGSVLVPGATCLTQALTLQSMLRRRGWLTEIKFGVRRNGEGRFHAHAWVEHNGRIVIGDDEAISDFTALPGGIA
jgi:hypothetical protein